MAHYNFDKDLKDGQQAEKEVMERLQHHFPEISGFQLSTSKGYDIEAMLDGERITFEVKNDLMAPKTGNVAIEYESRGKASGIATTVADYWVYKIGDRCWMLPTRLLRQKLLEEKNYHRDVAGGDPGSNTRMLLVKVEKFTGWGIEI